MQVRNLFCSKTYINQYFFFLNPNHFFVGSSYFGGSGCRTVALCGLFFNVHTDPIKKQGYLSAIILQIGQPGNSKQTFFSSVIALFQPRPYSPKYAVPIKSTAIKSLFDLAIIIQQFLQQLWDFHAFSRQLYLVTSLV